MGRSICPRKERGAIDLTDFAFRVLGGTHRDNSEIVTVCGLSYELAIRCDDNAIRRPSDDDRCLCRGALREKEQERHALDDLVRSITFNTGGGPIVDGKK